MKNRERENENYFTSMLLKRFSGFVLLLVNPKYLVLILRYELKVHMILLSWIFDTCINDHVSRYPAKTFHGKELQKKWFLKKIKSAEAWWRTGAFGRRMVNQFVCGNYANWGDCCGLGQTEQRTSRFRGDRGNEEERRLSPPKEITIIARAPVLDLLSYLQL